MISRTDSRPPKLSFTIVESPPFDEKSKPFRMRIGYTLVKQLVGWLVFSITLINGAQ